MNRKSPSKQCIPVKDKSSAIEDPDSSNPVDGDIPVLPFVANDHEPHGPRCGCGCVPPILSLFEMAELRRKAREAGRGLSTRTE